MADDKHDYCIAGNLRPADWKKRKSELNNGGSNELWEKTFNEFLEKRISLRYLKPIKIIQDNAKLQGEGFTIVSIQCALIEFLAALIIGKNYKYTRCGKSLTQYEYSNSNELFCNFLVSEEPFKNWFLNKDSAKNFYENVRCALLHEARTKNGWRILASGDKGVDVQKKIVWRNALQGAIEGYIQSYGQLLKQDKSVQEAFIRKFDHLADL